MIVKRRGMWVALFLLLPALCFPATWVDVEITCPVCGTVNVFKKPGSFGSYVNDGPARFQYVFWPAMTDTFMYTCRQCHLTTYMQDFQSIPPEKIAALAEMLRSEAAIAGAVVPYYEIPMPTRLTIAARVYRELGRDTEFWCEFHRIAGYHYAEAGEPDKAHAARSIALTQAEALVDNSQASARKEPLVILAAMRFFTGEPALARQTLAEAGAMTFEAPDRESKALDAYLSKLISDFRREVLDAGAQR